MLWSVSRALHHRRPTQHQFSMPALVSTLNNADADPLTNQITEESSTPPEEGKAAFTGRVQTTLRYYTPILGSTKTTVAIPVLVIYWLGKTKVKCSGNHIVR